jgi:hypothetical protein
MDTEGEQVNRECNWALVRIDTHRTEHQIAYFLTSCNRQIEFKSLPLSKTTVSGGDDPRTSTTVFLFEEFVPLEYRQQLYAGVQNRMTLALFFSPDKTKQWKQAATLKGRPLCGGSRV